MSITCSSIFSTSSETEMLTSFQFECSQMFQNICSEATSTFSIFSLMGAGWIGQASKLSCLNFVSRFSQNQWARRGTSFAFSAAMEGTFFHGCSTLRQGIVSPLEFGKGSIHSSFILAGCKLSGGIAPQSFILTQLFQCFAIVRINEVCGGVLVEREMGSFAEKMIRAGGTSLPLLFSGQILASCSVGHRVRQAKYDVQIEVQKKISSSAKVERSVLLSSLGEDLVTANGQNIRNLGFIETQRNEKVKSENRLFMAKSEGEGAKLPSSVSEDRDSFEHGAYQIPCSILDGAIGEKRPILKAILPEKTNRFISFDYVTGEETTPPLQSKFFTPLLYEVLEERYGNNPLSMSDDLQITPYRVNRFLAGELPHEIAIVRHMAEKFGIEETTLITAWEKDFLKMIEELYPLDSTCGPKRKRFVRLVRQVCLHVGRGSIRSTIDFENPESKGHYANLKDIFIRGILPRSLRALEYLHRFLKEADLIPPEKMRRRMAEALEELQLKLWTNSETEFDPFYSDAYDDEVIPIGIGSHRLIREGLENLSLVEEIQEPENAERRMIEEDCTRKLPELLRKVLATLPQEKRDILRELYGFEKEQRISREIAESLEVTRQAVEHTRDRTLEEVLRSQAALLDPFTHQDLLIKKDLDYSTEGSPSLDPPSSHSQSTSELSRVRNRRDKRDRQWIKEEFGISPEPLPLWYATIRNRLIDYVTQPDLFRGWERDFFTHSMEETVRSVRIFLYLDIQDSSDLRIPRVVRRIFGHREDFYSQILIAFQNYVGDAAYQNILSKKNGDTRKVKKKTSLASIQTEEDLIKEDKERIRTDFGLDSEGLEAHDLIVRELIDQYQVKVGSREADFFRYRPKEIVRIVRILVYLGNNITSQSRDQVATQVIRWFFPEPRIFRTAYTFFQRLFEPKQPLS